MKAKEVIRIGRKPQPRAFQRRIEKRFAFFVFGLGEFDNENGVFRGETDQHDKTDLRIDIVFHSAQPEREERAEHRDRGA